MVLDEMFTFMGGKIFRVYPSAFGSVLSRVLMIFPSFYILALQEENQIFNQIFMLFSHIAENHIKTLLKNSELSNNFFKALIQMALKGDFETCELLSPVITEIAALHELYTTSTTTTPSDCDISGWYQHLGEMVEVFRLKSMYPLDKDISDLFEEDAEKFFAFRVIAGDSVLEVYNILEGKILQQLLNSLWSDIQSFATTKCWQSIEATIYLLSCLSESITEDTEFVPQLFSILGQLPIQSTPLIKSTMTLAGNYSNLIDKNTLFLEKIVKDFFPAFENPDLKSVASQAFLSISKNSRCASILSHSITQLISLCAPILSNNNKILDDSSNFNILEALLYIISTLPSDTQVLNYSTQLLYPFILFIKNYYTIQLQQQQLQQQQQQTELPLLLSSINLLTKFCKIYDEEQVNEYGTTQQDNNSNNIKPVFEIINNIIPIYGELLSLNRLESSIIEAISIFYKKAIMINNNHTNIPEINRQLTLAFLKHTPLSLVLSTLSISIVNLPKEQHLNFLVDSLSSISSKIIQIWSEQPNQNNNSSKKNKKINNNFDNDDHDNNKNNNNNSNNNQIQFEDNELNEFKNLKISIFPDITKEYFTMITQYIRYNAVSIPQGVISHLFSIILVNITKIHDKVTARACFSFMALIITKSKEMKSQIKWEPLLNEINGWLSIHGELFIKQILYSAGGGIPRSVVQFISEVIASLVSSYPEVFRISALKCLSVDGFPSSNITKEQKEKFLNSLMLYRSKKLPLKIVTDFSLVSLGIATNQ
ncbi:hypothetical protein ACTFIU_004329 [Dictyostelium citrinum]